MNTTTNKRTWRGGILACFLAMLLSVPGFAQDLRPSSLGRIEALSLESGQVVIEGHIYALEVNNLIVVHEERVLDPGALQPGMDVAFGVGRSRDGQRTVIRTVKILSPATSLGTDD